MRPGRDVVVAGLRRLRRGSVAVQATRARRRARRAFPSLVVDGPEWLRSLLASSAMVRRRGGARAAIVVRGPGFRGTSADRHGGDVVGYRAEAPRQLDPAPFVAANAVWRRWPLRLAGAPEDIVLANRHARRQMPSVGSARRDPAAYLRSAGRAHRDYRAAYRRHAVAVVDDILGGARHGGRPGAAAPQVSVLCVSNRPSRLAGIVANYQRQSVESRELVVVAHGDGFDEAVLERTLGAVPGGRWSLAPREWTLGRCLNDGLERCRARHVAKLDDDDLYGAEYLADALLSSMISGAAVTGKHSYVANLIGSDMVIVRFPGQECRPSRYLAGGTLVLDREQLGDLAFPDLTIGEDQGLIREAWGAGLLVYSGDMFNYVQHRGDGNTWQASDPYLLRGSVVLGGSASIDAVMI